MKYQPELTSIRGLAALWVFVFHIDVILANIINIPVVSAGYLGVSVFFILSIALLLRSLDDNANMKRYFLRRIKRIWPMYFFTVILVFFVDKHTSAWLISQASFMGVFIDNTQINYVFWSLQIEEVAYITFPLIHRLSNDLKYKLGIGLYVSSIVILLAILSWEYPVRLLQLWWLPLSLGAYGLGILVYLRKIPKMVLPLAFISVVFWSHSAFVAMSCIVAPGFAYIIQEAHRIKILQSKYLAKIGDISYGLYLIHYLLLTVFGWIAIIIAIPFAWVFEKANKFVLNQVK